MKKIFLLCILIFTVLGIDAYAVSYEIYNHDEFTGITDVLEYYPEVSEEYDIKMPDLYINIYDLVHLNIRMKEIENGICITDGRTTVDIKREEPLSIGIYTFDLPILAKDKEQYINLDIIGKCLSATYSGTVKSGVHRVFLEVGELNSFDDIRLGNLSLNCDYVNNMMLFEFENVSNYKYRDVKIFVCYYDKKGRLLDTVLRNKYTVKSGENASLFIPVSDKFDEAGSVRLFLWCDGIFPLTEEVVIKSFIFDRSVTPPIDKEAVFYDVAPDDKYYDAIYIMNKQGFDFGMFEGYSDGGYRSDWSIGRDGVANVIASLVGMKFNKINNSVNADINIDYSFADDIEANYEDAVGFVVSKGYMKAENDYFKPNRSAKIIDVAYAFLKILGEDVESCEDILTLAANRNLLINIDEEETIVTRGNFTQMAYNFMMEYTKSE